MSTDIRKWMNLVEGRGTWSRFRKDDTWYDSYDLFDDFFYNKDFEEWEELINNVDGYNEAGMLAQAQEFWEEHIDQEGSKFHITAMELPPEVDDFMWKVEPKPLRESTSNTGIWYTDQEVYDKFIATANHESWWEEFIYVPDHEYLDHGKDAFQKYARSHVKPAWITDVRIEYADGEPGEKDEDGNFKVDVKVWWKIQQGEEDDPDEY